MVINDWGYSRYGSWDRTLRNLLLKSPERRMSRGKKRVHRTALRRADIWWPSKNEDETNKEMEKGWLEGVVEISRSVVSSLCLINIFFE